MAYDTDTDPVVDDDAPETEGIDPDDFDVPDVDDAALEAATQDNPLPKGRQRLRIVDGKMGASGEQSKNPGMPQFIFTVDLAEAGDEAYDTCTYRVFPPWDRNGDGAIFFPKWAARSVKGLQDATEVKLTGRSAAEVFDEIKDAEFDAIVKHETHAKIKRAVIDRFC